MTLLVPILVLVGLGTTAALAAALAPRSVPRDADRGGCEFTCVLLQTPRWFALAILWGVAVARGALPVGENHTAVYLILLAVHILLGLGCLACAVTSVGGPPVPPWIAAALRAAPTAVPLAELALVAWLLAARHGLVAAAGDAAVAAALTAFAALVAGFTLAGVAAFRHVQAHEVRSRVREFIDADFEHVSP